MLHRSITLIALTCAIYVFVSPGVCFGAVSVRPHTLDQTVAKRLAPAPQIKVSGINQAKLLAEDAAAFDADIAQYGAASKRLRFAVERSLDLNFARDAAVNTLDDGRTVWRVALNAAGATDLNIAFDHFALPDGAQLFVIGQNDDYVGPFSAQDRSRDGSLWLPVTAGESAIVELQLPQGVTVEAGTIHLAHLYAGYRDITAEDGGLLKATTSGSCNVDAACALGNPYRNEIRAVARMTFAGYLCTGTLVNNAEQNLTPYFLTANHCISSQSQANSLVTYWNYQSPICGQRGGGSLGQALTGGATLLAHRADVDFSLLQLNSSPPAGYNVYFAGWDASGVQPAGVVGIHHPSGDVKSLMEDSNGISTVNSCIGTGGTNSHWRTGYPYSQGTTEGGSSGSLILIPAGDATGRDRLIIGVLSGGNAECNGNLPNSGGDCYGKLSVAWNGTSPATRLKDWLDPAGAGVFQLAGLDPSGVAMHTVLAGVDGLGGTITPSGATTIAHGSRASFILKPSSGYALDSVDGSCGGSLSGFTYTTNPVNADCTVSVRFRSSPGAGALVCRTANHALLASFDGTSVDWANGLITDDDIQKDWNSYLSSSNLAFYWPEYGSGAGGVSQDGSTYAVLHGGDTVGSEQDFTASVLSSSTSNWRNGADGFLGFRFLCGSELCYGYAHLRTTAPNGYPATLVDYCYDANGASVVIPAADPSRIFYNGFE